MTSEKPFDGTNTKVSMKLFSYSKKIKIGVCTKNQKGLIQTQWMLCAPGTKYSPKIYDDPYATGFGLGDVITVMVTDNDVVSFHVNGKDFGPAFTGMKTLIGDSPLYLCVHLNNAFNLDQVVEGEDNALANVRPSAVQLLTGQKEDDS